MGRTQKDAIYSTPAHVTVFPQWKVAEKCGRKCNYPNGILTLESSYQIARYMTEDGSWDFRHSISGDEKFEEPKLEFLIADADKVYWKAIANDRLPEDKLTVIHEDEEKDNVWIGKHIKFRIGLVKRAGEDDVLTYISGENRCTDWNKFEVLCNKKN